MLPTPGTLDSPAKLRHLCRRSLIVLLMSLSTVCARSEPVDAWQAALNLDYNTAADSLARQHDAQPADSRIACAYAASLLVREPVTDTNVNKARSLLAVVLARDPATEPQYRPLALYLVARIDHAHVKPPRLEDARAHYEQLRREYPGHPLADEAAIHLGFLRALQMPPQDPQLAVAIVEDLLNQVSTQSALRELHHLIAHLQWHVRHDAAAALPHYIAGREIGFETPYRNSELDLTIAGLARELGRNDLAAKHYTAFAEANPRDARTQTVRRLAAEALELRGKIHE